MEIDFGLSKDARAMRQSGGCQVARLFAKRTDGYRRCCETVELTQCMGCS